ADQFEAALLWMSERPLLPGRPYLLRIHARDVTATVTQIRHRIDVRNGAHLAARTLGPNEIGVVNLSTGQPVVFEPHARNRTLGGFPLVDTLDFSIAAAGTIDFALQHASNIRWQVLEVNKATRALALDQRPRCVWFTGLSASGKSTIANVL